MQQITGALTTSFTNPAPPIDLYLPNRARANGAAIVIFPGGGYGMLAEHEGKGYADYFVQAGFACFVVSYRLGSAGFKHPAMLEDGLAAIGTVRQRAAQWGVDPNKIGVMGSSAGGHLAAHTLVANQRYRGPVSLRPDFGILCYPVIAMTGPHCHTGSRANLLGGNPSQALMTEVSCEQQVTVQTPPCFIWHTWEDAGVPVENSLMFGLALRQQGVPFELHVYQKGRHGLGLNAEFAWASDCLRWLGEINQKES